MHVVILQYIIIIIKYMQKAGEPENDAGFLKVYVIQFLSCTSNTTAKRSRAPMDKELNTCKAQRANVTGLTNWHNVEPPV